MKTVTLKLDWVTKTLLLIIAVSLLVIAFRPFLPAEVRANPDVIDVNIAEIGGYSQYGKTLDANVSGSVDVNIASIYGETYAYRTYGKLPIRGAIDVDNEVQVYVTNANEIGQ